MRQAAPPPRPGGNRSVPTFSRHGCGVDRFRSATSPPIASRATRYNRVLTRDDETGGTSTSQPGGRHDTAIRLGFVQRTWREGRRSSLHGLPRPLAAFHDPGQQAGGRHLRGRPRLRRLQHPRLAGDQRERHAGRAASRRRPSSIRSRSCRRWHDLQHPGPDHARGLSAATRATSPARPSTI